MAISTNTARDTIEMLGVSPDRIHIIGNGYNPRLFHIMERKQGEPILGRLLSRYHALPPWNKLVLYVGKFAAYKGLPYFIRAAAAYTNGETSNVLTLIVGEGSKTVRDRLESLVETAGLQKRILLPGKLAYEEVGPLMNMADVFILPSYTEGFGLVLLEALACGLRSVAADKGGPPFFVPDILREKGFVTLVKAPEFLEDHQLDPSDEERYVRDLGAAIVQHLASPPSQSERRTIADSVKNLTWTSRVKETISVYLSAIENRRNSYLEKT
jgi:glycosyltransferase involved in cell wall biosynthesis